MFRNRLSYMHDDAQNQILDIDAAEQAGGMRNLQDRRSRCSRHFGEDRLET